MRKSIKRIISGTFAGMLALAAAVALVPASSSAIALKPGAKKIMAQHKKFDPSGKTAYHAYFAFQTSPNYCFRNPWYDDYGKYENVKKQQTVKDADGNTTKVYDTPVGWGTQETEAAGSTKQDKLADLPGKFQDVTIKGNGTYTVGMYDLQGCLTDGKLTNIQEAWNMIRVSTDIPASARGTFKISDIHFSIDGVEKSSDVKEYYDPDAIEYAGLKCLDLLVINTYNDEMDQSLEQSPMANDSVQVTFTVSGFDVDDPDANGDKLGDASSSSASSTASSGSDASASSSSSSESTDQATAGNNSTATVFIVIGIIVVVLIIVFVIIGSVKKKNKGDGSQG